MVVGPYLAACNMAAVVAVHMEMDSLNSLDTYTDCNKMDYLHMDKRIVELEHLIL